MASLNFQNPLSSGFSFSVCATVPHQNPLCAASQQAAPPRAADRAARTGDYASDSDHAEAERCERKRRKAEKKRASRQRCEPADPTWELCERLENIHLSPQKKKKNRKGTTVHWADAVVTEIKVVDRYITPDMVFNKRDDKKQEPTPSTQPAQPDFPLKAGWSNPLVAPSATPWQMSSACIPAF